MIGRFDPHKGHEYFLRALHQLKQQGFNGKGVIVGVKPGEEANEYAQFINGLIAELGLEQAVVMRPFSAQVVTAFKALDVFVMPSPAETFGMVTIEAMASGVPVVGFAALGTQELLKKGEIGLLAAPKNSEELAQKMAVIWQNAERRKKLSQKGKEYVTAHFSKERFQTQITKLLT